MKATGLYYLAENQSVGVSQERGDSPNLNNLGVISRRTKLSTKSLFIGMVCLSKISRSEDNLQKGIQCAKARRYFISPMSYKDFSILALFPMD